jgi:hypothetical protein
MPSAHQRQFFLLILGLLYSSTYFGEYISVCSLSPVYRMERPTNRRLYVLRTYQNLLFMPTTISFTSSHSSLPSDTLEYTLGRPVVSSRLKSIRRALLILLGSEEPSGKAPIRKQFRSGRTAWTCLVFRNACGTRKYHARCTGIQYGDLYRGRSWANTSIKRHGRSVTCCFFRGVEFC